MLNPVLTAQGATVVEVVPLTGVDRALAYRTPDTMRDQVHVGSLVRMPLRRRHEIGIVRRLGSDSGLPLKRLRALTDTVYPFPAVSRDLLQLAAWMQVYYAASGEAVFETMIPAPIRRGLKPKRIKVLKLGLVSPDAAEMAALQQRAPKQAALYGFLKTQAQPIPRTEVLKRLKVGAGSCDALIRRGWIVEELHREERVAYDDTLAGAEHNAAAEEFTLTGEQAAAAAALAKSLESQQFAVHLLQGVTGSGKTEVYLQAIFTAVADGGSAIFLVPEVALTPQTVGRLRTRLARVGVKAVVWHSRLTEGERFDAWEALATGRAQVVVGARSAVFAPVLNLRLIIVDEEHEPAYKQEEAPRYHGRDVAVYRSQLCGAVCVVGSATPSLESLYNVEIGKYVVNKLTRRVDDRQMPTVHVVDLRREAPKAGEGGTLSQLLREKLCERFERREQSILFLNRRGYARSVICPECGYVAECTECSLALTYHRLDERLRCHLCRHEEHMPQACPHCGGEEIRRRGQGTQRVEAGVRRLLPHARIVRMDADAVRRGKGFRGVLADFRLGKIDVLVGTQMIGKGLDFPNVTLVGIVDADVSLHMPDFRASERTFQLLVQVAGRAGRGDRTGEVVVQTFTPHSAPIQFARHSDFEGFLSEELAQRKAFRYPPYRRLVRHVFQGRNPDKVSFFIEQWARRLEEMVGDTIEIRGPTPTPLERLRGEYRFQLWYFMESVTRSLPRISEVRKGFAMDGAVRDVLDVDPMNLL